MIKLKSLFRRGQGSSPSSTSSATNATKNTNQVSPAHTVPLKSSASASSLDRVASAAPGSSSADLGATRKLSKSNKHSSKDKLNDLLKASSKEKLIDDKKELKKQQKLQQKQMQQVAQQQAANLHGTASKSNVTSNEQPQRQDYDIGFDGSKDVSNLLIKTIFKLLKPEASFFLFKFSQIWFKSFHFHLIN